LDIEDLTKINPEGINAGLTRIVGKDGETGKMASWGSSLHLSRELIFDTGALNLLKIIGIKLGEAAGRLEAIRTYEVLESNPVMEDGKTLFHVDKGNIITGNAQISEPGFCDGMSALRNQPNVAGGKANNTLRHIVCPVEDEFMALKYKEMLGMRDVTVTASPWVTSGWYMFADPEVAPTMALLQFEIGKTASVWALKPKISMPGMGIGVFADFQVMAMSRIGAVKIEF
jgi:hypothetical protein